MYTAHVIIMNSQYIPINDCCNYSIQAEVNLEILGIDHFNLKKYTVTRYSRSTKCSLFELSEIPWSYLGQIQDMAAVLAVRGGIGWADCNIISLLSSISYVEIILR